MRQIHQFSPCKISLNQSFKRGSYRIRKHVVFGATFLLLKNLDRLSKVRVAPADLLLQNFHLRVLASETEHCCSGYIRMIDVSRDQATEIVRVLACAAAAALVES